MAVDAEFSGLHDGLTKILKLDMPAERYQKINKSAMQFLIIQFGLSIFQYDKARKKYANKTYNFYVFPNSNDSWRNDVKFLSQASSLKFLATQGFDFNKLFLEGKLK